METANFGKTNYHVSIMKLVMTDHQKQTVFLHQLPLFQAPLDRFFSSYLMLRILVIFLGYQLQHELPQTRCVYWCILVKTKNFNMPNPTIKYS